MGESFTDEEQNCRFFDAYDQISTPSSSNRCSNVSDEIEVAETRFGVWMENPGSVVSRRHRFLEWMAITGEKHLDVNTTGYDDDRRVMESNGAVLRSSGFEDGFRSSRSSQSCWTSDSSDWSGELMVKGEEFMCRDNGEKECGLGEINFMATPTRRSKKGWLNRLRSFTCVMNEEEGSGLNADSSRLQRIKVRHCEKKSKELSALFSGQDFQAHKGAILKMKFSPDGRFLASAGEDGVVRVWQVLEDDWSDEVDTPELDPSCMYFTVNRSSELTPFFVEKEKGRKMRGNSDSACVIFPPKVFRLVETPLHEFYGHEGEILDLSWSNHNYLLSSSADKTVRLWQVGCTRCLRVFKHSNYVTSVQFNPVDDKYFISGSIDGKVRIWAVESSLVVDWTDIRDIVTAVCYRPNGEGVLVGSIAGSCRFYSISDNRLQLDAEVCLCSKKKSPCKRITGFEFFPQDSSKVMVTCGDSQIRFLHGLHVVRRYRGTRSSGNQSSASFTSDGKHIISTSEHSNVYMWNCDNSLTSSESKPIKSFERFSSNASVAIPWQGMKLTNSENRLGSTPSCFSLSQEFFLETFSKGSATWPEEQLPPSPSASASAMHKTQYKFLMSSCQSARHSWGLVIVTAGWDGRIRSFLNHGLPLPT